MRLIPAIRALEDTLADKTRRRVSQDELVELCSTLALSVKANFSPDLVVAIDEGGSLPGELLGKALEIPVAHITIRRHINIGRRYDLDPAPLRWCMSLYHHYLFQTTTPTIQGRVTEPITQKNILIVDDALHTGSTVKVAKEYLELEGAGQIKVATLSFVSTLKPDYFVLPKGNYSFPWSKDYVDEPDSI